MRRRDFITLLGSVAAWPLVARAQQPAMPVIGYLSAVTSSRLPLFRRGLEEVGYVEGRNVAIEYRDAEDHYDRLPEMAADLVRRRVDVVVAAGGPSAAAAKAAAQTIPIVFLVGYDPVNVELVTSLNRPGGNLTGVSVLETEVESKRLEILHGLVPRATVIGLLINPINPNAEIVSRDVQAAADALGVQLHILRASNERDFEAVFATLAELRAGGLIIGGDPFLSRHGQQLAALTVRHRVPTIALYREFVAAGGLMSYGGSLTEGYRIVGNYAGRILRGEKPADLPVQQVTKVELVINLQTARVLNLDVRSSLLKC